VPSSSSLIVRIIYHALFIDRPVGAERGGVALVGYEIGEREARGVGGVGARRQQPSGLARRERYVEAVELHIEPIAARLDIGLFMRPTAKERRRAPGGLDAVEGGALAR